MQQEINFIYEYYDKIVKSLDYDINPKTLITLQIKIDIYSKLFKFCTSGDDNTDKVYQIYNDLLNNYCNKFKDNNFSIKNLVDFIENYETLIKYLYFAFNYLDKHYTKHNELVNIKKELPDKILLENILDKNFSKIEDEISLIINQIRINEYRNTQELIYQTKANVFFKILESKDKKKIYLDKLNNNILISTHYYESINLDYQSNSSEFILKNLKEIWTNEKKIHQELSPKFVNLIEVNFKQITIKNKIDQLINNNLTGITSLLKNNNFNSLFFLIENVNLDNDIEIKISDKISSYFYDINKNLLESNLVVDNIIKVVESYKYYFGMLNKSNFNLFMNDLESKMKLLVNSNIKFIEIIINLFDSILKSPKEVITNFEILIDFIKFFDDTDYFYCIYQNKLENRLFNKLSNYQDESNFFKKLGDKYPYRKSTKIHTLFQDIENSDAFNFELKNLCNFKDDIFNVKILTTTYWNINKNGYFKDINLDNDNYNNNIILTKELFNLKFDSLRKLYINQLEGEIDIDFGSSKIKTIPIIASVLFCYNTLDILNFDEILEKTLIQKDMLNEIIKLLLESNILLKLADNMYRINTNLEKSEIKLNFNNKVEKKKETKDTFKNIRIEAILVKIMKQNKKLNITDLIFKTKENLKLFNPDEDTIRNIIKKLIDREYFEDNDGIIHYEFL